VHRGYSWTESASISAERPVHASGMGCLSGSAQLSA
jgi:hypothetical protein